MIEVLLDRWIRMVVGKGAIDLGQDGMMLPRQPLDQHVEDRARRAVSGIPADAKRLAGEVLEEPVDIDFANVDLFNSAGAIEPVARGRAAANRLNLRTENGTSLQEQLEPVVIGR